MGSAGFKEWAIVCEALGRGNQTVIVRKGGIAEGRDGFSFREREFFLFPTFFHEQIERTRLADVTLPLQTAGEIAIRYFAQVERVKLITTWREAEALQPFHVLLEEVIRERFAYDDAPGLHVAFVRVFRLDPEWRLVDEKRYGGCRSWVSLPDKDPACRLIPVLDDGEFERRLAVFDQALSA